jgi:hypothetical protein
MLLSHGIAGTKGRSMLVRLTVHVVSKKRAADSKKRHFIGSNRNITTVGTNHAYLRLVGLHDLHKHRQKVSLLPLRLQNQGGIKIQSSFEFCQSSKAKYSS